jgi:hypothetical protein
MSPNESIWEETKAFRKEHQWVIPSMHKYDIGYKLELIIAKALKRDARGLMLYGGKLEPEEVAWAAVQAIMKYQLNKMLEMKISHAKASDETGS